MQDVSIIIPCYNEEATIPLLLNAIYHQTYSRELIEVVIADGFSSDNTRSVIKKFVDDHPDLRIILVDNPKRNIPSGLNRAIEESNGDILIRLDAHSIPSQDYVSRTVELLEDEIGDNVGGVWKIKPGGEGWISRSIAYAAAHPLGVGDANYRLGTEPGKVDTVPFGAFRRSLIKKIGPFDETLLSNEDYEFNVRVKENGGIVWLDPKIWSIYIARNTYLDLAKQYWRYGFWKSKMLIRYPKTLRWRQIAGLFVLTWILLGVLSIWSPLARWFLLAEASIYGLALFVSGFQLALKHADFLLILGVPISIAVMHFSWGTAFLWGLVHQVFVQSRE